MVYTITLIVLFIITLFYINKNDGNIIRDKRYILMIFILLWVLSAVRYQEGYSDFRNNVIGMVNIRDMGLDEIFSQSEFFHQLFRKILSIISSDPQLYFIVSAFIINLAVMMFGFKYTESLPIYVIMYYCVFYYFTFNNITRQGIAVALVIFGYINLLKKRKIWYFIFLILATLTHRSAFIAILPFFLCKIKINRTTIIAYISSFVALAIANKPITALSIRYIYTDYTSGYGLETANSLYYIYVILAVIMVTSFVNLVTSEDAPKFLIRSNANNFGSIEFQEAIGFIANGTIIYAACIMLSCMNMLMYARVSLYFVPCFAMCIDQVLQRSSFNNRRAIVLILLLFSLAIFTVMNINGKLIPTPYHTFWSITNRIQ